MCEPTTFGLRRGLESALRRRAEWSEFSRRGRELVESELNWSATAIRLADEYARVAKTRIR
jgi:glycosyltransferase involved in cell wall biosynthesis